MIKTSTKIIYTADDEKPSCSVCDNMKDSKCTCEWFCKEENRWCYYHRSVDKFVT